jgi:hypothetical protein
MSTPEIIIGFDSEYVNGARAEGSLPSDSNILLIRWWS